MAIWSLLGFFGVLLPVLLFSIGTPKIGTGFGTIIGAAELPIAVIESVFILNEHVSLMLQGTVPILSVELYILIYTLLQGDCPRLVVNL